VTYEITIDLRAHDDIAALPAGALPRLAEVFAFLQLTPWNTRPINPDNADGAVRTLAFGDGGMITVLVLDSLHRVDVLTVSWIR
jgi:hypothetical protein